MLDATKKTTARTSVAILYFMRIPHPGPLPEGEGKREFEI
jgi:hypothetical protein